ncbi:hypothetical protein AKJ51_03735 [candidate division MSBL1 archaeon SCGC-AAA382A20]|uniref:Uncharacterized protein n=1 Tax=candidate division MSBL1 archaeon SCGC-AAA382A20 TaxID=1698280 RepID=A0A133VJ01_9EURY|nr:hypothetical protein AKJ51_03735 [candidate division MSBL1 archaeon SCGC-AAA382A20]
MSLDRFLHEEEKVLKEYKNFYATNERVIRHENGLLMEEATSFSYDYIRPSVEEESEGRIGLAIPGGVLIVFSFVAAMFSLYALLTLLAAGTALIVSSLIFKRSQYVLEAPETAEKRLEIPDGSEEAESFAEFIRERAEGGGHEASKGIRVR